MRKILLSIVGYLLHFCLLGQNVKTDSMLKALPKLKEDTSKVIHLIRLGETYEGSDPANGRKYLVMARELSEKLKYDHGIYLFNTYYANTFLIQGNFDSALHYQNAALKVSEKMKDSLNIGISLFNIGVSYRDNGQFEKAIEYCLKGRPIVERKATPYLLVQLDDALQILYYRRAQYDKAEEYGKKALAAAKKNGFRTMQATALINLSMNYVSLKRLDEATNALKDALQIGMEEQDIRIQSTVYQNLGGIALEKKDYPRVKFYLEKSWPLFKAVGMKESETGVIRGLGIVELQTGNFAEAKKYAQMALDSSRKYNFRFEGISSLRLLTHIAYAEGRLDQGMDYDDEMIVELEKMVQEVLSQQSSDLEKKYETEKKESRIVQLEAEKQIQLLRMRQKNTLNYILLGSALALMLIILLLYRNYRHKQALQQKRINELQTEKQLAATEAVLKGEEKERTRLAKDLHDGLGGMLSGIKYSFNTMKGNLVMTPENMQAFERGIDMLDSSINEMRRVAHNLMPEALVKFGLDAALKDFCADINQSGSIALQYQSIGLEQAEVDSNTSIAVYRIVQELVGNVLKHAAATKALVQVVRNNEGISVTVEDDGKGFDTGIIRAARGIGWSNIASRVDYLKGKLDVQSEPGKGTSVLIEIPIA
ncbi:sensor histidine kinase [Parasegetibacter sp. NRK P23]|uniref:ATP-binding protein n=1 Tax=Parasegetibacter sp. NRK P23 TaxID=2942999 RepID=UPI002042D03D|nr:sensor histidine kinase [Parasegetibacter sp. NRK P23]MCM5527227.1 sensor histidine kinase [Parasegetibacter sp. NRK P23]